MKIAIVTATFPPYRGGTGNVAYHHARLMHERGHEVTVFTAAQKNKDAQLSTFPFTVHYLPVIFRVGNAPLTLQLFTKLQGFDVVHLHYPYIFGSEITLLIARHRRIPIIVSYHNRLEEQTLGKRILFAVYNRLFESWICTSADILAPVSRDHLASLHPGWMTQSNIAEIPNGVDLEEFVIRDRALARTRLGLPKEKKLVLFVGALDKAHRSKNVPILIHATSELKRTDIDLVIVGDGDLRTEFETEIKHAGLVERTHFVGSKGHQDLAWYYSAADVTVLPSSGQESFGLVLVESMACGTAVIASDLPGVRTVVPTDVTRGRLVVPRDVKQLAQAIDATIRQDIDENDRQNLRSWVSDSFSWSVVGDHLEAIYGKLLLG